MYVTRRITSAARSLYQKGLTPIRGLRGQVSRLRSNNVITRTGQRLRGTRQRFSHYLRVPQRYLGNTFQFSNDAGDGGEEERKTYEDVSGGFELGSNPQKAKQRFHQKKRVKRDAPTVNHLQIHLIDRASGKHEIVHVGQGANQQQAHYIVDGQRLYFSLAQDKELLADANVIIQSPDESFILNGEPIYDVALLPKESDLIIGKRHYFVDIQPEYVSTLEPAYVYAAWGTNTGTVRRDNQDAIGVYEADDLKFYAIADGVGSGYRGDKMSEFAVKYLLSAISINYGRDVDWVAVLSDVMTNANIEMRNFLNNLEQRAGTTFTVVLIEEWSATILHVGDSRLYLQRDHHISLLTQDHSEVVPVDDASTENFIETRVVLSKAIGKSNQISPDIFVLPLKAFDRLFLCTDGITTPIPDDELAQILDEQLLHQLPDYLMTLANERRTTDNASVVIVDILNQQQRQQSDDKRQQDRVFVASPQRPIRYQQLKQINTKRPDQQAENDDEKTSTGCGCSILALLVILLIMIVMLGMSFIPLPWQNTSSSALIDTPTATPVIVETQESTPQSQILATITLEVFVTAEQQFVNPTVTANRPVVEATVTAGSFSEQATVVITAQILTPTPVVTIGATTTLRPTNESR